MKRVDILKKSDDELIHSFCHDGVLDAFDVLLRRYYNQFHRRFYKYVKDSELANDLSQKLWMKVLNALQDYQAKDKFEYFLNTIASNLLKDHWRACASSRSSDYLNDGEAIETAFDNYAHESATLGAEDQLENKRKIDKLIHELIPALPCEQRLTYLLKHEAEYWDQERPLQWQHLADLLNESPNSVCHYFEVARDKLLRNTNDSQPQEPLECIETTVFMLWTLAQRRDKSKKYTESYFADLLNIPVNTFKTRYRASVKTLAEGLTE